MIYAPLSLSLLCPPGALPRRESELPPLAILLLINIALGSWHVP